MKYETIFSFDENFTMFYSHRYIKWIIFSMN
nr:MAG TPA: hypothetical protein [Caudoviricetes sp.]